MTHSNVLFHHSAIALSLLLILPLAGCGEDTQTTVEMTVSPVEAASKIATLGGSATGGEEPSVLLEVSPFDNEVMTYLKYLPGLKQLWIFGPNRITDDGIAQIAELTTLSRLHLDTVMITDEGISHLKGLTNLKKLGIINTAIRGSGLIHLRGLLKLEILDLSFNTEMTDEALTHLGGLSELKTLTLDYTKVTPAAVEKLKTALPKCQIFMNSERPSETRPSDATKMAERAEGERTKFDLSSAATGDWPQWRGPNRDNVSHETGLLQELPSDGPEVIWKTKIGSGYSSFAVQQGRLFTTGINVKDSSPRTEVSLVAIDLTSKGQLLWAFPISGEKAYATPTADGNRVYVLSMYGDLICASTDKGDVIWNRNIVHEFNVDPEAFEHFGGYAESVLIDGDNLICTPGAMDAMVVCLNKHDGKTIWKTAIPMNVGPNGDDSAGHASAVISNAGGIRQYVQLAGRGLISVAADDGRVLWTYNDIASYHTCISTPIISDDYVFTSTTGPATGSTGTALLKLVSADNVIKPEVVYRLSNRVVGNHYGGMVRVGDYIYFSHGYNRGFPMCLEMKTGKIAWQPGRGPGQGSASVLYADGRIYFRYSNDIIAMVEATPEKYIPKGTFRVGEGVGGEYSHPVIAGGCLYVRSQELLYCYNLKK